MMKTLGRRLSSEEVLEVALRAIDGEDCLDRLVCGLVFGNPKGPRETSMYSQDAWDSWGEAVLMYDALREQFNISQDRKRKGNVRRVELDEAWAALLHVSKEVSPGEGRFSWALVGEILGIGARAAQYQLLQRMGFKVRGTSDRRGVTAGPCLKCGKVTKVKLLKELACPSCREV